MELRNDKKGFTLVEMLVVIAIIGIMSTLAVSGYVGYRKQVLLDLAVDNFVSQLNQMRSRASYGEGEGSCYGIYFERVGGVFTPKSFSQEFVGRKIWQNSDAGSDAGWKYEGCPEPDPDTFDSLGWDDQIVIKSIDGVAGDFFLRALPPEGKLETDLQNVPQNVPQNQLNLVIGYAGAVGAAAPGDEISMTIDIANGTFNRIPTITDEADEIE